MASIFFSMALCLSFSNLTGPSDNSWTDCVVCMCAYVYVWCWKLMCLVHTFFAVCVNKEGLTCFRSAHCCSIFIFSSTVKAKPHTHAHTNTHTHTHTLTRSTCPVIYQITNLIYNHTLTNAAVHLFDKYKSVDLLVDSTLCFISSFQ